MKTKRWFEEQYEAFDLPDAFRIACEMNIDVTKPEPWLRVYYDTVSQWGVGFVGPEWKPAFIHALVVLIQEFVAHPEKDWDWRSLPDGAEDLCDRDQLILQNL